MTTINDLPETANRWQARPQAPGIQPAAFTRVVEILWQLAVEEYPAWSHDQKRRWAERTANQMFAEYAGPRPPAPVFG